MKPPDHLGDGHRREGVLFGDEHSSVVEQDTHPGPVAGRKSRRQPGVRDQPGVGSEPFRLGIGRVSPVPVENSAGRQHRRHAELHAQLRGHDIGDRPAVVAAGIPDCPLSEPDADGFDAGRIGTVPPPDLLGELAGPLHVDAGWHGLVHDVADREARSAGEPVRPVPGAESSEQSRLPVDRPAGRGQPGGRQQSRLDSGPRSHRRMQHMLLRGGPRPVVEAARRVGRHAERCPGRGLVESEQVGARGRQPRRGRAHRWAGRSRPLRTCSSPSRRGTSPRNRPPPRAAHARRTPRAARPRPAARGRSPCRDATNSRRACRSGQSPPRACCRGTPPSGRARWPRHRGRARCQRAVFPVRTRQCGSRRKAPEPRTGSPSDTAWLCRGRPPAPVMWWSPRRHPQVLPQGRRPWLIA